MPPHIVPHIAGLPSVTPFVGPEALERLRGVSFRARIGANESVFGPSPRVIEAMAKAAAESWMYGDPEQHDLKSAIAAHHGVRIENVAIDSGIDALFGIVVRLAASPGDTIVTSLGGYPTFIFHCDGLGARLVRVPYKDDREDWPGLLEAARKEKARLLYFANPDNPMGSWWGAADVQRLIDGVPDGCLLVLDEAYSDTAPPDAIPPLDMANPSVLRFRTFSKAYGMAGVRVGYCLGHPDVIRHFDKIRNHFDVTRMSQAGAIAALADQPYLKEVVARIARARERISAIATANGLKALPSATNFVAVDCGRDGTFARKVLSELIARGVFVRMPGVAPLDRCIRISAGTDADLDILAEALPQALKAAAAVA
jgi:histidinol-phosphate aminotransferase